MVSEATLEQLHEQARQLAPQLQSWRRHLHTHPELSFVEHQTQAYLRQELQLMGLAARSVAQTGLVADIAMASAEGSRPPQHCVAIRADMDALPIQEVPGRVYGSQVAGVMHACGHDVHMTCALGAAWLLKQLAAELPCPVRLIFQPGEELLPGGATRVIADGGLADPDVAAIVALHVAPDLPVRTLSLRDGRLHGQCR